jgi:hypothetical protein
MSYHLPIGQAAFFMRALITIRQPQILQRMIEPRKCWHAWQINNRSRASLPITLCSQMDSRRQTMGRHKT